MPQSFSVPTALLTLFLLALWPEGPVTAQIVPDNTLLEEDSIVSPGAEAGMLPNVVISGGAQRDTSLFHSFEDFNINPGQQVRFANPSLVEHIFSRVTGGQVSRIDGLLGVNGLADLFFLNPNGVIFGPNAELDVSGSFVVTTGDRILFNNNIGFSAVNPDAPPLLNISSPTGVQFGTTPQPIQINGALIGGRPGDSFIGIGGNVTLDDTTIRIPGGQIILGGIASAGIVSLNLNADRPQSTVQFPKGEEGIALADVVLQEGSALTTIANGGGDILIHADTVQISGSELLVGVTTPSGGVSGAPTSGPDFSNSLQAGNILIEASGDVRLSDQSRIRNQVLPNALGEGGDIIISSQNLTLIEGSNILTDTASVGSAGDINVTVRDRLLLQSGALTLPDPPKAMRPAPPSGAISPPPRPEESPRRPPPSGAISPPPRREGGSGRPTPPGVLPPTAQLPPPADIPPLRTQRREFIASSSDDGGIGTTGNVTVDASQIILDGFVSIEVVTNGAGQGGNIVLNANSLEALRGGFINNLSDGPSDTGDIQIRATDINLDTRNNVAPERGGISTTLAINSNGATGGLTLIETENLTVAGAQLGSIVGGQNGQGGDVVIRAGEMIKLTGDETTDATGISSGGGDIISAVRMRGSGQGGNIRIFVPHLLVENGSEIDASVSGSGRGGSIDIQADESIILRGVLRGKPSQISTQLNQGDGGQGGNIRISTADLTVQDGGQISATTLRDGPGGQVTIQASDRIVLTGASPNVVLPPREADAPLVLNADGTIFPSGIFASSPGLGETRSVQIRTPQLEVLDRAQISTSSKIAGTTGEIQIDADELTLNNSIISAEAVEGDGGNIELNLQDQLFLLEGSEISTAASGTASGGNIDIDDPSVVVLQGGSKISASNVSEVREADGGNVDLRADFLLSVPDGPNQILARAFGGDGGDISVDTLSIYGDFGENLSNIDASSQRGISGNVTIQPIEIDPTRSVLELPSALADANDQIRNSCAPGERGRGSFVATGRSGLPPSPVSTLFGSMILTDLGPFVDDAVSQMGHLNSIDVPLQEAKSVDIAANGTVTLAAAAPASLMMADSISISFLIQGQVAYRAADYTGAIATWTQALQQLSSQVNNPEQTLLQASLWNNLALAYHHIGDWEQTLQAVATSQSLLDSLESSGGLNSPIEIAVQAQFLNTQAKLQFSTGNAQDAIASWQQAAITYRHAQDERGMVQSQLNQVQALKSLGFYQQAQQQLDDLLPQLTHTSNQGDQAIALILQSVLLQQMGDGVASRNVLANRSAAIVNAVNALNDATLASTARLNLGQLAHYQAGDKTALAYYQQAIASATTSLEQFQGQLSLLELLSTQDSQQDSLVKALLQNVSSLPANRDSLYAQLHFAWWLMNE
ncbi:MAG: filamentous hemagglutinin N-terminal domain-containing protein, partial [Leptolyngbya sp. SIO3F4]|nr:filamentous hemagglutinin N-terminal domain-containing protein [Leptolyngbya sp. SIO3F4]